MTETKRIIFIVNPISGTTGKKRILQLIESRLDKEKYSYDIVTTKYQGHATEIARAAANQGVDIVCAIGGDGTVNETARALVHTDTALAIIPCGSGNGLARHLHIPVDPVGAIKVLNEGTVLPMDYGLVNEHPFFCTCGVGFDAFISMRFAQAGKRGPLTYAENILKTGLQYNPETYDVEVEGDEDATNKTSYKAFLISCANACQYGNNAYIAPQASVRDGLLDVTIIEPFGPIDAPAISFQLFNGTIDKNSRIKTFRCKKLHIHRQDRGAIHYDGDPIETGKDVDVEIVPQSILCVASSKEGMVAPAENIQNFIAEHFNDMYLRSEELLQRNIIMTQRIGKLNSDIMRKLSGRKKE
ncbi:MAG: diacylglycerol kinase family lipid kinase [Bacteroidaceae bacterium]|nr:diacylglycerol kinase family lipid kinase [Bacteroidaceae bacterium]